MEKGKEREKERKGGIMHVTCMSKGGERSQGGLKAPGPTKVWYGMVDFHDQRLVAVAVIIDPALVSAFTPTCHSF